MVPYMYIIQCFLLFLYSASLQVFWTILLTCSACRGTEYGEINEGGLEADYSDGIIEKLEILGETQIIAWDNRAYAV